MTYWQTYNNESTQKVKNDTLLAQNIAFADRGFNLELASSLSKPIVIYNIFKNDLENKFINISNNIKLINSDITVIEYNIDNSNSSFFKNTFPNLSRLTPQYSPEKNTKSTPDEPLENLAYWNHAQMVERKQLYR